MHLLTWRNLFTFLALLEKGLGHHPATATSRPTPGREPKVHLPRDTQTQPVISTSTLTSPIFESPRAAPIIISTENATFPPACETFVAMILSCKSKSPGFNYLPLTNQARCLSYPNTTVWMPEIFDDAVTSCEQAVSATPSDYSVVLGWDGLCTDVGGVFSTTDTGSTTSSGGTKTISPLPTTASLARSSGTQTASTSASPGAGNGNKNGIQSKNLVLFLTGIIKINKSSIFDGTKGRNRTRRMCITVPGRILVRPAESFPPL